MQVFRAGTTEAAVQSHGLGATWLAGPAQGDGLDVAVVSFDAGAATPEHVHHGGQVLVVLSGTGYVEVSGAREVLQPGDVVVTPAGEQHVHGAAGSGPFSHVSVTTGRNELLGASVPYPAAGAAGPSPTRG